MARRRWFIEKLSPVKLSDFGLKLSSVTFSCPAHSWPPLSPLSASLLPFKLQLVVGDDDDDVDVAPHFILCARQNFSQFVCLAFYDATPCHCHNTTAPPPHFTPTPCSYSNRRISLPHSLGLVRAQIIYNCFASLHFN